MQISDNYGNHILYFLELTIKFARQDRLPYNSDFHVVFLNLTMLKLMCSRHCIVDIRWCVLWLLSSEYGGSSVTRSDQIISIANQAKQTIERGDKLVLVVSARQGRTDHLIEMAKMVVITLNQQWTY